MPKTEAMPKKGMARLFELAGTHRGLVVSSGVLAVLSSVASFVPYLVVYFLIQELIAVFPNFYSLAAIPRRRLTAT